MENLERTRPQLPSDSGDGPSGAAVQQVGQRLQSSSRLLNAGRSAIDRALSANADTFLRQVRQQGGQ